CARSWGGLLSPEYFDFW
nr:immunoglobulin heavy chain junction region [Macaca mulatta]MOX64856.1 immunoglobulin heavy chain junction region [Macaca mulatta]MOX68576.1 immunoglobulin heavy chain junction region [Macaca mulatta]